MSYFLAASIGGLVAFIFSTPAILLEMIGRGRVQNLPLLVDIKTIFGRRLEQGEIFFAAVFFYVASGALMAAAYVLFVNQDWLFITRSPYSFLSLIIFSVGSWIVLGGLLMPALRMGFFGAKEGRWVWLELLSGMLLVGFGVWIVVKYFQPSFF